MNKSLILYDINLQNYKNSKVIENIVEYEYNIHCCLIEDNCDNNDNYWDSQLFKKYVNAGKQSTILHKVLLDSLAVFIYELSGKKLMYDIIVLIISYYKINCVACLQNQPNQLAHMYPGGCLYLR